MRRTLRLAPTEKLPPLELHAVQAVLDAWKGRDWLWCGDEEMAQLAVSACRTAFEHHREVHDEDPDDGDPEMGDGGSAA